MVDPNGHHLWYKKTTCPCGGRLDRDDTTSGGPENIFWPKGKGPKGNYSYYVLYFSGHGRKKVVIEVRKAGKVIRTHKVVLKRQHEQSEHFSYDLR